MANQTTTMALSILSVNPVLVGRLTREYNRAIRAEEAAPTERVAWRLAAVSERCLRRLQAARAGLPLPESRQPRTVRAIARQAFEALGTIGLVIGRAIARAAALRKAQAASALARVARKAAKLARAALRGVVRAIARKALAIRSAISVVMPQAPLHTRRMQQSTNIARAFAFAPIVTLSIGLAVSFIEGLRP